MSEITQFQDATVKAILTQLPPKDRERYQGLLSNNAFMFSQIETEKNLRLLDSQDPGVAVEAIKNLRSIYAGKNTDATEEQLTGVTSELLSMSTSFYRVRPRVYGYPQEQTEELLDTAFFRRGKKIKQREQILRERLVLERMLPHKEPPAILKRIIGHK